MPDRRGFLVGLGASALGACVKLPSRPTDENANVPTAGETDLPPIPGLNREFRGAWVASVANIDWPSKPGLSSEQQQAEILSLLDRAQQLKLNAIILQVRPAADALYPSELEPWSEYLSGTQGKAPEPFYDPLQVWINASHQRGLELHAWLNPFRARHSSAKSPPVASHVSRRLANGVRNYGDMLWLDPADPEAMAHSIAVVADITRRYDIDGIHIDDYFYPYPVKANAKVGDGGTAIEAAATLDFPDEVPWNSYRNAGGTLDRADWRRSHVNHFVEQLYRTVHQIKPWVRVGISPFGLGQPGRRPQGITGFSQYDQLYADVEHWLAQRWFDYLAPQLYWPIRQPAQAFDVLHEYWLRQDRGDRHIWPGLFTSQIGAPTKSWEPAEILEQVAMSRRQNQAGGHIHFSMVALAQNRREIATRLAAESYAEPALVPASPWLGDAVPPVPTLRHDGNSVTVGSTFDDTQWLLVWRLDGGAWRLSIQRATNKPIAVTINSGAIAVAVAMVSRTGVVGPRSLLRLTP